MVEAKCMHKSGLHLVGNGIHASNAKDIVRDDGEQNPIRAHKFKKVGNRIQIPVYARTGLKI